MLFREPASSLKLTVKYIELALLLHLCTLLFSNSYKMRK